MIDRVKSLSDAIMYVITSSIDMGDSLWDEAEYLAQHAGISYGTYDDEDPAELLRKAITTLVRIKSSELTSYLKYYFTEPDMTGDIFDNIVSSWGLTYRSPMYIAIHDIYENIGNIPGGNVVRKAIQENVYTPLEDFAIDAAKVGKAIGELYWRYISAPAYGPISNGGSATGHIIHYDEYTYEFSKEISNYYFRDRCSGPQCPRGVGFTCKFRESGPDVVADIYIIAVYSSNGEMISDTPAHSVVISSFKDSDITVAARQIADYFNDNVEEAIEFGIR